MLIFLPLLFEGTEALQCLGKSGEFECCNGYMWNDITKDCSTRCPPGYFGVNCTRHCSPGRYGNGCAYQCAECEKTECNVSYGCPVTKTEITRLTLHPRREQFQGTRNSSQESIDKDKNTENILQILSLCFSVGIFAVITTVFAYRHICRNLMKTNASPQAENNSSMNVDKNYEVLNNKTVYSGMANVQINLNRVEKNFSIFLNTEESTNIDALLQLENMEPRCPNTLGGSVNGSVKHYETVC
ncbi:uncharacterized protein LOC133178878 [Saccostrea echinata]|uniref:uncharacterized protein LOC133178878 n=1 Tax=Saccostrea echinata TaxID=191078 RepID=UPI002A83CA79|nr:uncharacterized protein LOC133178878 [Saccostrea echinata]